MSTLGLLIYDLMLVYNGIGALAVAAMTAFSGVLYVAFIAYLQDRAWIYPGLGDDWVF